MNCPNCRRGVDYEASLSTPNTKERKNKQLVYFCSPCQTLYIFKEITTKLAIGGRLVMSMGNIKRAGYLDLNNNPSALTGGHQKISNLSLSELENSKTGGDTP